MKRRAAVAYSFELLAKLLHLREGISIVRIDVDSETETVVVVLDGDTLAPVKCREPIVRVPPREVMDWELVVP